MSESTPGSQKKGVAREADHSSQGNSQQMQFGILYPSTSLAGDRPSNKAPGTIEENKNIRTETKAEETQDNGVNQSDESASKQQNNSRSKPDDASARRKQRDNPSSLGDPHDGSIVKPVTEKDQDSDGHKTMERSMLYETHTQSKFTNLSSYNDKSIQPKLKYTGKGPPKVLHGNNNQQSAASVRQSGRSKHAILQGDASSYGSAFDTSAGSDKLKSNGEYEISKQGRVWCIRDLKTNKLTTLKTIKADEVFFESKELVSVDGVFHQLIVHNGKKPKLEIAERSSSSSEDERKPNACDFSYGSDDYSESRTTPNSLPESEEPSSRFQKQSNITRTENAMEYMKPGAGTDLFKETEAEETQSSDVNQSDERVSKQQNNTRSKYDDVSARPKRSLYEGNDRGQASPSYNPGSTGGSHDGSTEQPRKPRVTGTGQETEAEETQGSAVNRSNEKAGKQQNSSRSNPDDASARQKGSSDDGGQPSPRYNSGSTGDSHDRSTEKPGKPPVNGTGQETEAEETQGSGVNQSDERASEKQNNSHSNPDYASKRKKQGPGDGGDGGQPSPRYYSWLTGGSHDGSTEHPGKPPITGTAQETECKTQGNLFLKPPTPPPRKSKMQGGKTVDNPQTTNMQRTLHTDTADVKDVLGSQVSISSLDSFEIIDPKEADCKEQEKNDNTTQDKFPPDGTSLECMNSMQPRSKSEAAQVQKKPLSNDQFCIKVQGPFLTVQDKHNPRCKLVLPKANDAHFEGELLCVDGSCFDLFVEANSLKSCKVQSLNPSGDQNDKAVSEEPLLAQETKMQVVENFAKRGNCGDMLGQEHAVGPNTEQHHSSAFGFKPIVVKQKVPKFVVKIISQDSFKSNFKTNFPDAAYKVENEKGNTADIRISGSLACHEWFQGEIYYCRVPMSDIKNGELIPKFPVKLDKYMLKCYGELGTVLWDILSEENQILVWCSLSSADEVVSKLKKAIKKVEHSCEIDDSALPPLIMKKMKEMHNVLHVKIVWSLDEDYTFSVFCYQEDAPDIKKYLKDLCSFKKSTKEDSFHSTADTFKDLREAFKYSIANANGQTIAVLNVEAVNLDAEAIVVLKENESMEDVSKSISRNGNQIVVEYPQEGHEQSRAKHKVAESMEYALVEIKKRNCFSVAVACSYSKSWANGYKYLKSVLVEIFEFLKQNADIPYSFILCTGTSNDFGYNACQQILQKGKPDAYEERSSPNDVHAHAPEGVDQTKSDSVTYTVEKPLAAENEASRSANETTGGSRTESSKLKVHVLKEEIVYVKADVIVNSTSEDLDLEHGHVSAKINKHAGKKLQKAVNKEAKKINFWDYIVTKPFDLSNCKHIFHCALEPLKDIDQNDQKDICLSNMRAMVRMLLNEANKMSCHSIALPALGTGNLGYNPKDAANAIFLAVCDFVELNGDTSHLKEIKIVIYEKEENTFQAFKQVEAKMAQAIFGVPFDLCVVEYRQAVFDFSRTTAAKLEEIHFVDIKANVVKSIQDEFCNRQQPVDEKRFRQYKLNKHRSFESSFERKPKHSSDNENSGMHLKFKKENHTTVALINEPFYKLEILKGDLSAVDTDAVVLTIDENGKPRKLTKHIQGKVNANTSYFEEVRFKQRLNNTTGNVIATGGCGSKYKVILHVILPCNLKYKESKEKVDDLQTAYTHIFDELSKELQLRKVTTVLLGKGVNDVKFCASILWKSFHAFCRKELKGKAVHVVVVCYDTEEFEATRTAILEDALRETSSHSHDETDLNKDTPFAQSALENEDEDCVICMDTVKDPYPLKCGHMFCKECILKQFEFKKVCPMCGHVCGIIEGNQPTGKMIVSKESRNCHGYWNCGSILMRYEFPDGKQQEGHPNPGSSYRGIRRTGYLPDNAAGKTICRMMKIAFKRKLVFTIGNSRTTRRDGVITWNDIHHKTDPKPYTQSGYPDDTYLDRVKEELEINGVTEKDIDSVSRLEGVVYTN
ncbi:uncharacterized protein LOC128211429 isoform X2 [Mya arenaria]|uniref:uncharacterized protein LOC128211429 isoform X2 n=1 Tax=Mya arenaria TaxID=6604 RepID=UPI0022E10EE6|nr:uncharacterized protein LOC128211429 isoform X2 [Mya arenaria]